VKKDPELLGEAWKRFPLIDTVWYVIITVNTGVGGKRKRAGQSDQWESSLVVQMDKTENVVDSGPLYYCLCMAWYALDSVRTEYGGGHFSNAKIISAICNYITP
jgi:hypothetical protein